MEKWIVLEIQTDKTTGVLTYTYDSEMEAIGKFHLILASAAASSIPCHTAMVVRENGMLVRTECIKHEVTE